MFGSKVQRLLLSILIGFNMLEFIQKFQPHLPLQKYGNPTNHVFNAAIRANLTNHFLNDVITGKALLPSLVCCCKSENTNYFYNNVITGKALLPSLVCCCRSENTNHLYYDVVTGKALLPSLVCCCRSENTNHLYYDVITRKALLPSLECCCKSEEVESTPCQPSPHGRCDPRGVLSSFVNHLPCENFE